jgi:transposase
MKFEKPLSVSELLSIIKEDVIAKGNLQAVVTGIDEIHSVENGDLSFVDHPKYYDKVLNSVATVILINKDDVCIPEGKAILVTKDPLEAFLKIVRHFVKFKPQKRGGGIMQYIPSAMNRHQTILFNSLEEWINDDNLVRVIDILVDKLAQNEPGKFIYKGHSNVGRKPYSPVDLMKLYVYGYFYEISSSRRLEAETKRNMEIKWLLGNLQPDFKTIADFRKDNRESMRFACLALKQLMLDENHLGDSTGEVKTLMAKLKAKNKKQIINKLEYLERGLENFLDPKNDTIEELEHSFEKLANKFEIEETLLKKVLMQTERIEELEAELEMYRPATNRDEVVVYEEDEE